MDCCEAGIISSMIDDRTIKQIRLLKLNVNSYYYSTPITRDNAALGVLLLSCQTVPPIL